MNREAIVRGALLLSVPYNLLGASLFAFPQSALGRLAGMPVPVPAVYSALLAFFVALLGGTYAWLALQPEIDRPLVGFAAIGKTGVFVIALVFWLLGKTPGSGVLTALPDLVLAGVFAWWLLGPRPAGRDA